MSFWSHEKFLDEQKKFPFLISNFDKDRLKYGRYSLRLGREVLVTPDESANMPAPGEGPCVKIPPGQFAILFTLESIHVPPNAIGFISVKTSTKWKGLVNISGFHVDPGFNGHLKFSVYNAGNNTICLNYESECFLLWFCGLDKTTTHTWDKENKFQKALFTPEDHEQMSDTRQSPAALHDRIEKIEDDIRSIIAVGVVIIFPLLISFGFSTFDHWYSAGTVEHSTGELALGVSLITSFAMVCVFAFYRWFKKR